MTVIIASSFLLSFIGGFMLFILNDIFDLKYTLRSALIQTVVMVVLIQTVMIYIFGVPLK